MSRLAAIPSRVCRSCQQRHVFDDVDGTHEPNINAIANEGITFGCNEDGTLFCPLGDVTRGQIAAFLYRALTDA